METHLIPINDFCKGYEIDLSFIIELQEYELIELKIIDNDKFITIEEMPKVEKMIRLHQDLSINIEGIEAIYYLLERTQQMRQEIQLLKQKLRIHEEH